MFLCFPFFPLKDVRHVLRVARRQFSARNVTGILIVTAFQVGEVLRPGQQCALAYLTVCRQTLHVQFHSPHHFMHEPVGYAKPLLGIDEPKENYVTEQHAPVGCRSGTEAAPNPWCEPEPSANARYRRRRTDYAPSQTLWTRAFLRPEPPGPGFRKSPLEARNGTTPHPRCRYRCPNCR